MSEPLTVEWKSGPARDKLWWCRKKHIVASFRQPKSCHVCTAIAQAVAASKKLLQEAHNAALDAVIEGAQADIDAGIDSNTSGLREAIDIAEGLKQ